MYKIDAHSETHKAVLKYMEKYPTQYEDQVILNMIYDPDFYNQFATVIGFNPDGQWEGKDFTDNISNKLYNVVFAFNNIRKDHNTVLDANMVGTYAKAWTNADNGFLPEEASAINAKFTALMGEQRVQPEWVAQGMYEWLRLRKTVLIYDQGVNFHSAGKLSSMLSKACAQLDTTQEGNEKFRFWFGEGRFKSIDTKERYSTGIAGWDKALGGGLAKQEFTLVIAPTGAGKTVNATQTAWHLVKQGLRGIFVTTEQGCHELEPRIHSMAKDIPFEIIKDGIDFAVLPDDYKKAIIDVEDVMSEGLQFIEWNKDISKSLSNNLEEEVIRFQEENGCIDFVIFDWLGGGLGNMSGDQLQHHRQLYNQTGTTMGRLSKKYDLISLGYCQANKVQARGKRNIDATMIQDCKTLGDCAEAITGISALYEDDDSMVQGEPPYRDIQCFFTSKCRKGTGGEAMVLRDFGYQRFKDK